MSEADISRGPGLTGETIARAVREGWCCRACGGGFCRHVSPLRCPRCGARRRPLPNRRDAEVRDEQ